MSCMVCASDARPVPHVPSSSHDGQAPTGYTAIQVPMRIYGYISAQSIRDNCVRNCVRIVARSCALHFLA